MSATATGGLTAVGILIPATLVAVQISHPNAAALSSVFFGDLWFALSLVCGLYVLWISGVKVSTENVLNRKDVGISHGLQLLALLVGVARLLFGIYLVFSNAK